MGGGGSLSLENFGFSEFIHLSLGHSPTTLAELNASIAKSIEVHAHGLEGQCDKLKDVCNLGWAIFHGSVLNL